MNQYLSNLLNKSSGYPEEERNNMMREAQIMDQIGISSDEDYKYFHYINLHLPKIANELLGRAVLTEEIGKMSSILFDNREAYPIDTIFNFYTAAERAINKIGIPIKKMAYPSGIGDNLKTNPRNIQKWMGTMQQLYQLVHQGVNYNQASTELLNNWEIMEQKDFRNWMRFYEEGAHKKYKIANHLEVGSGNFIPMEHLRSQMPMRMPEMQEYLPKKTQEQEDKEDVKKKIKGIISRLNSAERMSTDWRVQQELQKYLDIGVSKWLETLQSIKRHIQLIPIKHNYAAHAGIQDQILRQANILETQGGPKAARMLRKIAQTPVVTSAPADAAAALPAPTGASALPASALPAPVSPEDDEEAMRALIEVLNNEDDDQKNDDQSANDLVVTAQEALSELSPEEGMPELPPEERIVPEDLEVLENEIDKSQIGDVAETHIHSKTDELLESALSQITMQDIISRLEVLANLFRTREIPRQLAIIDLMMDKLNVSAFFPSLAEASSKSLESNQYALTRVEDILSKLRGSISTPKEQEINLTGRQIEPVTEVPEGVTPEDVAQDLQRRHEMDQAEKARPEVREPMVPEEVPIPEELTQPAQVQRPIR